MWQYRYHDRSSIHGVLDTYIDIGSLCATEILTVSDSSPLDRKDPH